jgi:hypothetical protein
MENFSLIKLPECPIFSFKFPNKETELKGIPVEMREPTKTQDWPVLSDCGFYITTCWPRTSSTFSPFWTMKDCSKKPEEEISLITNTSSTTSTCHKSWDSIWDLTKVTTLKPMPPLQTNTLPLPAVITTPDSPPFIKPTISTCPTTKWDT